MAKKLEPWRPTIWSIYKIAAKQTRAWHRRSRDECAAIQKAAEEFKQPALYASGGD
jgi:hypothetical protein